MFSAYAERWVIAQGVGGSGFPGNALRARSPTFAELGRRFEIGIAIVHIGCGGFDDVTGPLRLSPFHRAAPQNKALSESFDGRVVWLKAGEPTPLEA